VISDVEDLADGAVLDADVGIVGAGFAGIDLARRLGAAGVQVVLLESGRREFDPATQELGRVISVGKPLRTPSPDSPFTPYLPEIFRGEFRIRQLGGTSNSDRGGPVAHYRASMYVEQAPAAESQLRLADSVDALGMPRLVVDRRLGELDRR
jgi:choline dehydrogenase-like flavoprotein